MAVLALTQSQSLEFFKDKGKTINSFVCILIILFLVGYPLFTYFFMRNNQAKLNDPVYESKYNSIYLSINTKNQASLLSTSFFMVRRLLLAAVIVFLGSHQTFQLILAETVCIFLLVYQIRYSPMKESLFNRLEYLNEATLLSTTLLMTCFTDYTPNEIPSPVV
jgi:hypothetical protein